MCIILFAWQQDPENPLMVAANRDEFHHRPAEPARWRGDLLCGLDLEAGGTWLGVTRAGRFAAVTNFREPVADRSQGNRSRGMLPLGFLESDASPSDYLSQLAPEQQEYGAFNLLVGDAQSLWYMSNRGAEPQAVEPGIYALSNGLLGTPWPKTERGTELLAQTMNADDRCNAMLDILHDQHLPEDGELPDTGVGLELERLVAPIFIAAATYGTRASTALTLSTSGFELCEKRWGAGGTPLGETDRFQSTD